MIDLHCHILPGIDDGAPNLETSLELAHQAVDDGITQIVATPHFRYPIDFAAQLVARENAATQLRHALKEHDLPLEIMCGGEFQVDETPFETLRQFPGMCYPTQGDATPRAVLIELPPAADVLRAGDILFQAQLHQEAPEHIVIAHPERQPGFCEHTKQLKELFERGLRLQFNADTFVHTFWMRKVIHSALELMRFAPQQVYLSTDAHDATMRPCRLSVAHKAIAGALGEEFWTQLTERNPRVLLGQ